MLRRHSQSSTTNQLPVINLQCVDLSITYPPLSCLLAGRETLPFWQCIQKSARGISSLTMQPGPRPIGQPTHTAPQNVPNGCHTQFNNSLISSWWLDTEQSAAQSDSEPEKKIEASTVLTTIWQQLPTFWSSVCNSAKGWLMRSDAQQGEFLNLTNFGSGLIVGLQHH